MKKIMDVRRKIDHGSNPCDGHFLKILYVPHKIDNVSNIRTYNFRNTWSSKYSSPKPVRFSFACVVNVGDGDMQSPNINQKSSEVGFEPTTFCLGGRRAIHCATRTNLLCNCREWESTSIWLDEETLKLKLLEWCIWLSHLPHTHGVARLILAQSIFFSPKVNIRNNRTTYSSLESNPVPSLW